MGGCSQCVYDCSRLTLSWSGEQLAPAPAWPAQPRTTDRADGGALSVQRWATAVAAVAVDSGLLACRILGSEQQTPGFQNPSSGNSHTIIKRPITRAAVGRFQSRNHSQPRETGIIMYDKPQTAVRTPHLVSRCPSLYCLYNMLSRLSHRYMHITQARLMRPARASANRPP